MLHFSWHRSRKEAVPELSLLIELDRIILEAKNDELVQSNDSRTIPQIVVMPESKRTFFFGVSTNPLLL